MFEGFKLLAGRLWRTPISGVYVFGVVSKLLDRPGEDLPGPVAILLTHSSADKQRTGSRPGLELLQAHLSAD